MNFIPENLKVIVVGNALVKFTWPNSSDTDPIDTNLKYRLQVSRDFYFTDIVVDVGDIEEGVLTTSYILTFSEKLPESTVYFWRVSAYDGKEYSEWSCVSIFELVPETTDLLAKIKLVTYVINDLYCKIYVIPYEDFPAQIWVPKNEDLSASITLVTTEDLPAKIEIPIGSTILATIDIYVYDYSDISGSMSINYAEELSAKISIFTIEDLSAKINVEVNNQELKSQIVVGDSLYDDIYAKLTIVGAVKAKIVVIQSGYNDLNSEITVSTYYSVDLISRINIPSFSDVGSKLIVEIYDYSDLNGVIDVEEDIPSDVVISADVTEGVWQEQGTINFSWTEAIDEFYSVNYLVAWNQTEDYEVTGSDQNYGTLRVAEKTASISGHWYFHVRARNSIGNFAFNTSHFYVMYNRKPTAPSDPLLIEGLASPAPIKTVAPTFTWTNSTDQDQLDVLVYRLQIASDYSFTNIIQDIDDIDQGLLSYTEYVLEEIYYLVDVGTYYWRVLANDGKQEGNWSDISEFDLVANTEDIVASLNIATYRFNDLYAKILILFYEDLEAQIFIKGTSDLSASIVLTRFSDLPSTITIPPGSNLPSSISVLNIGNKDIEAMLFINYAVNLAAIITIPTVDDVFAKIRIFSDLQQLKASINVGLLVNKDLDAQLTVVGPIKARINIFKELFDDLFATITVVIRDEIDLSSQINILPYSDIKASIFVKQYGYVNLFGQLNSVASRPSVVVISSDVDEGVWQEESVIDFTWTEAFDNWFTVIYYVAWNQDENYEVTAADQNYGISREATKEAFLAGHWYFHVRAKNSIGNFAVETSHYHIQYNHAPSVPSTPFLVNGIETGVIINTTTPTFTWTNSVDVDQQDIIKYNLQVSTDVSFNNISVDIEDIDQGLFSYTDYTLSIADQLGGEGVYYWRVSATDGKEDSDWSVINAFEVVPLEEDIFAKLNIPIRQKKDLSCVIYIIDYEVLKAKIDVFNEEIVFLEARITLVIYDDNDLRAKIFVAGYSYLPAIINIIEYEDIYAQLSVVDIYGYDELNSVINIVEYGDYRLNGQLTVKYGSQSDLDSIIFVSVYGIEKIDASIDVYVPSSDLGAVITVMKSDEVDIEAVIDVEESRPGPVTLYANVPEGVWQENNEIEFTWDEATTGFFALDGYYVKLDHNPSTEADYSFQKISGLYKNYDLELEDGAGSYWFHIAAVDTISHIGPTTHFNVLYNHVPTNPTLPMTINGDDSYGDIPVIGSQEAQLFEWGQSYDDDSLDVITYHLQVSSDSSFDNIVESISSISFYSYQFDAGELNESGHYYWRVRAYDGNQYSGWSPIAQFRVNTPPSVPTELSVAGI